MQDKNPAHAGERATLKDVLNYDPEAYITDEEIDLIRRTFNSRMVINVLRKIFLPTAFDGEIPIENQTMDIYMQGYKLEQIPADEAKIVMLARQDTIKIIMGGLIKLKSIAASKEETEMEKALRRSKDSVK